MKQSIKRIALLTFMLGTAVIAKMMQPTLEIASFPHSHLEELIPKSFGDWKLSESISPVLPDPATMQAISNIYSDVLTRTYSNKNGRKIMLSLAYGRNQNDTLRVHLPEGCYTGQGFAVKQLGTASFQIDGKSIPVMQLSTKLGNRSEPVTYWIVTGGKHATNQTEMKIAQLGFGLRGLIPDGLLFRVSSITTDDSDAFELSEIFVRDLMASVPEKVKNGLIGL